MGRAGVETRAETRTSELVPAVPGSITELVEGLSAGSDGIGYVDETRMRAVGVIVGKKVGEELLKFGYQQTIVIK